MTTPKRKVEVFIAGCGLCDETVALVERLACGSCDVSVHDMQEQPSRRKPGSTECIPFPQW
jgi:hypothetical protein